VNGIIKISFLVQVSYSAGVGWIATQTSTALMSGPRNGLGRRIA